MRQAVARFLQLLQDFVGLRVSPLSCHKGSSPTQLHSLQLGPSLSHDIKLQTTAQLPSWQHCCKQCSALVAKRLSRRCCFPSAAPLAVEAFPLHLPLS